jgi:hypothetical protein
MIIGRFAHVAQPTEDIARHLWVSNSSSSGSDWELDEVSRPSGLVQIRRGYRVFTGERQRRVALQRRVRTCRVVVRLELGKLPFQITGSPEQHLVEEFLPYRPDHALHEGV